LTRILFLHEVGYLEKPIFEMHEFPEHLSKRGHDVAFLDFLEFDHGDEKVRWGESRRGRVVPGANFLHFSQTNPFSGLTKRLFAALTFSACFRSVLDEFRPDVVVSFSVPTSGWQALHICRSLKIPYIFRALDVSHKIRKSKWESLIKLAEKYIYRNSDWVSCNNPSMREYCISLGAREGSSSVDLPPLDLSHFEAVAGADQELRRSLGIPLGATVFLYMGSFFYFSGLENVLLALSAEESKPYLVLIGGGECETGLKTLAKDLEIEHWVRFTGYVPFAELPSYLAIADVALNPMVPSLVSHNALPNKVLQYMASGLPVVSTKLEGLHSLLGDARGLRLVSEPDDVLSEAVQFARDANKIEVGLGNRKAVRDNFATENAVDHFEHLIENLCKKP